MDMLMQSSSETKQAYLRYYAVGGDITQLIGDVNAGKRPMPMRFADMTMQRHAAHQQHPVYLTSNNVSSWGTCVSTRFRSWSQHVQYPEVKDQEEFAQCLINC